MKSQRLSQSFQCRDDFRQIPVDPAFGKAESVTFPDAYERKAPNFSGIIAEHAGSLKIRIVHRSHARAIAVLAAGPMRHHVPPLFPVTQQK